MSKHQVLHSIAILVLLLALLSSSLGVVMAALPARNASEGMPPAPTTPAAVTDDQAIPADGTAPTVASSMWVPFSGKRVIVALPQGQAASEGGLMIGQVRLVDAAAQPKSAAQPTAVAQLQPGEADAAAGDTSNPYYSVQTITLSDGTQLERMTINGPPQPPPGSELERAPVALSALNRPGVASSLSVPAYSWVFGCSAVSASMIGAYFDRNGLSNIYTGPTNGGVMPMDNSVWPTWTDGDETYPGNPLTASRKGSDGRTIRGSIDDYWVAYGSTAQDPYITGGWAQHAWGDAFGDYMKTSQSAYDNTDGGTGFYNSPGAARLTCAAMESNGMASDDGTYGRKLFYEARGYTVADCYSQKTDNQVTGGFSFAQYKAMIDAGYPVLLNLAGHSIVGVGYADPSTVYINDTWDYQTHSMTWGGSYSRMALQAVSVVNPVGPITPTETPRVTPIVTGTPGPSGTLMTEDFEGTWPATGWQIYGSSSVGNDAYLLGKRNCHPHTGGFAGWSVGGGTQGNALSCNANYPNDVFTSAVYGPFDLSDATSASLSFYVWGKAEPEDAGYCYDALLWGSTTTDDFSDYEGMGTCADATGGSAGNGYYKVTLDLAQRLGASQVWVVIAFSSDESVNDIGYTVDDVVLSVGGSDPEPTPTRTPMSATSTPTPTRTPMSATATPTRTPMSATATPTATRTPMSATATPTATRTPMGTYTISGLVTASGAGLSGVTVSDGAGHSATTDTSGNYTLSGLATGTYTVMPAKSGCTFTPASLSETVPPSKSGQDFAATCGAGGTRVKVVPGSPVVNLSGTFNVTVVVADVTNLGAYQTDLVYDPAIVQVTAVSQGTFLSSTGRTIFPVPTRIDNVAGRVVFGAATIGDGAGPDGGGVLATVTFQAKAVGTSALRLENLKLGDPQSASIPATSEDGQVRVTNCFGDFNGDHQVDIMDLQMAAAHWNCKTGQACYDAQFDVVPNGEIDIMDLQKIAAVWNTTCGTGQAGQPRASVAWPAEVAAVGVGLQPVRVEIAPGALFTQTIRLQDVSDLSAFQADVTYDPAVVKVEGVTLGGMLGSTGRTVVPLAPVIDNTAGRVTWGVFSYGTEAGVTGSGEVATVRFRAVQAGQTALSFQQIKVSDTHGNPLEVGSVTGSSAVVGASAQHRTLLPLILSKR